MGADHAYFRGEGGAVIQMDLPLPEVMQDKVVKGYLRRVNADGSPYADPVAQGEDEAEEVEAPPASNASKAHWVGYAHRVHGVSIDDAEAMTKNDLMELYGSKG